jgi:hypothetical protein
VRPRRNLLMVAVCTQPYWVLHLQSDDTQLPVVLQALQTTTCDVVCSSAKTVHVFKRLALTTLPLPVKQMHVCY